MIGGFIEVHRYGTQDPYLVGIDHIVAITPSRHVIVTKKDDGSQISESQVIGTDVYTDSSKQYCHIYLIQVNEDYENVRRMISESVHKVFDAYRKRVGS